VQSHLPGIRGRIVKRVAWNRIHRDRPLLDRIADLNARQRIEQGFERVATTRLSRLNTRFQELRLALATKSARQPNAQVEVFTTDRYLEICLGPVGAKQAPILPEHELPAHPLQVWIHSSALNAQAPPLLQSWELLRPVIVSAVADSHARGIQLQTSPGGVPLHVATAAPWVVIGAGEPESLAEPQAELATRRR
jgi:hypothetical protein